MGHMSHFPLRHDDVPITLKLIYSLRHSSNHSYWPQNRKNSLKTYDDSNKSLFVLRNDDLILTK